MFSRTTQPTYNPNGATPSQIDAELADLEDHDLQRKINWAGPVPLGQKWEDLSDEQRTAQRARNELARRENARRALDAAQAAAQTASENQAEYLKHRDTIAAQRAAKLASYNGESI